MILGRLKIPRPTWRVFSTRLIFRTRLTTRQAIDPYGDAWSRLGESDRADLPSWRAHYAAQVSSIDRNLGRLMEALDEFGLASDTVLVFTSDHGEMFGAHGRRAKNIFF